MSTRTLLRVVTIAVISQSLVGCFAFGGGHRESASPERRSRRSGALEAIGAGLALAGAIVEIAAESKRHDYCRSWMSSTTPPQMTDRWTSQQPSKSQDAVWIAGSAPPGDAIRTEIVSIRAGDVRSDTPDAVRDQVLSLARARGAIAVDEVFYTPPVGTMGPKVRMLVTTDEGPYVRVTVAERPVAGTRSFIHYDPTVEYSPKCAATRVTYLPRQESYPETRTATITQVTAEQTCPDALAWADLPPVPADAFRGAGDVSARLWFPMASADPR